MPRIIEDPTQAVCPSFESAGWDFLRQSMINAHQGVVPLTPEEATQTLKDTWARENGAKVAAWDAQVEQDHANQVELDRLAQEETDAQLALRQKEAEDQLWEAERKKPKLNDFDPNRVISDWIEPRPAPYAINRLNSLEYVELDYFTTKGCIEAGADTAESANLDTLAFTQLDGTISVRPLAAVRSSRNIRNNEDLSWEEMLQGKNVMLRFMAKSTTWPQAHAQSLAAFFVALEWHPRTAQVNSKRALLLYQSRARREWFTALKRNEGFNIKHIGEGLLRTAVDEVDRAVQREEFEQVRTHAPRVSYAPADLAPVLSRPLLYYFSPTPGRLPPSALLHRRPIPCHYAVIPAAPLPITLCFSHRALILPSAKTPCRAIAHLACSPCHAVPRTLASSANRCT
ncbi:hypothetical protein EDB92DRAFT_1807283 [Lactarius akahatsu]|uniref:Uncharacterized protein n=1 Tax=Lactarius akahatsu TaxID=416441 RepID=A0AAD4L3T7_9AGAM|nr:hypothetical protein EDB92DRAFT_1807283 [Lactarius akahatsu]